MSAAIRGFVATHDVAKLGDEEDDAAFEFQQDADQRRQQLICATSPSFPVFSALIRPASFGNILETVCATPPKFGTEIRLFVTLPTSQTSSELPKRFGTWNTLSATHSRFPNFIRAHIHPISFTTQCLAGRRRHLNNGWRYDDAISHGGSHFYRLSNEPNPAKIVQAAWKLEPFPCGPVPASLSRR